MLLAAPVNQTERLYKIEQMLSESGALPIKTMLERLEISRATFKRDLDYPRDRLHAPIVWDRALSGYRFDGSAGRGTRAGPRHELPGLWFNSSEAYALLAMRQLLVMDVLRHGADVEVLGPPALRTAVLPQARTVVSRHAKP